MATIRELATWAMQNNYLDKEVRIQHRDYGGNYHGSDPLNLNEIEFKIPETEKPFDDEIDYPTIVL